MKKRLLTLVLAMAMVLTLAACGSKGDDAADAATEQAAEEPAAEEEEAAAEEPAAEEEAVEEEAGMTLDEWMQSEEAQLTEEMTNAALESQGITVKLLADGNTFVYEYTMPDEYSTLSEDDLAAAFEPVIAENEKGMADLFETFESEYGIKLDGVRFAFVTSDGTTLYSADSKNE